MAPNSYASQVRLLTNDSTTVRNVREGLLKVGLVPDKTVGLEIAISTNPRKVKLPEFEKLFAEFVRQRLAASEISGYGFSVEVIPGSDTVTLQLFVGIPSHMAAAFETADQLLLSELLGRLAEEVRQWLSKLPKPS